MSLFKAGGFLSVFFFNFPNKCYQMRDLALLGAFSSATVCFPWVHDACSDAVEQLFGFRTSGLLPFFLTSYRQVLNFKYGSCHLAKHQEIFFANPGTQSVYRLERGEPFSPWVPQLTSRMRWRTPGSSSPPPSACPNLLTLGLGDE